MNEILLENWAYHVEIRGNDIWRLSGRVYGHPNYPEGHSVFVSTPKHFCKETRTILTCSGRVYKLGSCSGDEDEQIRHIIGDIERGGSLQW